VIRVPSERLWRLDGVVFVVLAVVAFALAGPRPGLAASPAALDAYFVGNESPVLVGAILTALGLLALLWFATGIRAVLAQAGQDGWGSAVTTGASVTAALLLLQCAVIATLAYTIAQAGNDAITGALNDLAWAIFVLSSWPRAMLILASTFGLWRAARASRPVVAGGAAIGLATLLAGTTWEADFGALWRPDGIWSAAVAPILDLLWVLGASRVIAMVPDPGR
jgi:hypothetical protein